MSLAVYDVCVCDKSSRPCVLTQKYSELIQNIFIFMAADFRWSRHIITCLIDSQKLGTKVLTHLIQGYFKMQIVGKDTVFVIVEKNSMRCVSHSVSHSVVSRLDDV